MVASNASIKRELAAGNILIHPFEPKNISTSSYDLRLGENFFRQRIPGPKEPRPIYNIWSKKSMEYVWNADKPHKAVRASEILTRDEIDFADPEEGITESSLIIVLAPGETILGHTIEFIGGINDITTAMQARSSIGRSGIEVCKCAGWGDVGYANRWTMEITNNSRHYHVPLVVGRRVAQLVFFRTDPVEGNSYADTGKYSSSKQIAVLEKEWNPGMMLPRLYKDREARGVSA